MSAPAVIVRFEFEASPSLYVDAVREGDHARLVQWLEQHPRYLRLIQEALELEAERRAA
ncbi:MAG: hypothetical protein ACJ75Q_00600 [Gaiellaceae bacterium]